MDIRPPLECKHTESKKRVAMVFHGNVELVRGGEVLHHALERVSVNGPKSISVARFEVIQVLDLESLRAHEPVPDRFGWNIQ